jgi:hypothetical protein
VVITVSAIKVDQCERCLHHHHHRRRHSFFRSGCSSGSWRESPGSVCWKASKADPNNLGCLLKKAGCLRRGAGYCAKVLVNSAFLGWSAAHLDQGVV